MKHLSYINCIEQAAQTNSFVSDQPELCTQTDQMNPHVQNFQAC